MGSRLRPRPPAERPDSTVREGKALGSLPPAPCPLPRAPCPLPPAPCPLPRPALPCVSTGREHRVVCWLLAFRRAAGTGREDPQPDTNPSQLCFAVTFGRLYIELRKAAESKKAPLEPEAEGLTNARPCSTRGRTSCELARKTWRRERQRWPAWRRSPGRPKMTRTTRATRARATTWKGCPRVKGYPFA